MFRRPFALPVLVGFAWCLQAPSFPIAPAQGAPHSIREDMGPIDRLLRDHDKISYRVTFIPGGVRTVTTSKDKDLERIIQLHAREMKARMEQGNVIRPNDPIFQELFRRHQDITIHLRDVAGGVVESETSRDPQVVLLIRAHTQTVAGFVREGMPRARRMTPLPPGYRRPPAVRSESK